MCPVKCRMKSLIHSETSRLHCWSLRMDKWFLSTCHNGGTYLSMSELRLIHVSKKGCRCLIILKFCTENDSINAMDCAKLDNWHISFGQINSKLQANWYISYGQMRFQEIWVEDEFLSDVPYCNRPFPISWSWLHTSFINQMESLFHPHPDPDQMITTIFCIWHDIWAFMSWWKTW